MSDYCYECKRIDGPISCMPNTTCADHVRDPKSFSQEQWLYEYKREDCPRWSAQGWFIGSIEVSDNFDINCIRGSYPVRVSGTNLFSELPRTSFNWSLPDVDGQFNYMALTAREQAIVMATMPENNPHHYRHLRA